MDERSGQTAKAMAPCGRAARRDDNAPMPRKLLFHDLIMAPAREHGYGVYWLRLYAVGATRVAVVTEVPGNPGQSVVNASEAIVEEILRQFEVDAGSLALFLVMPSGFTGGALTAWQVHDSPELRWDRVTIGDIEGFVGQPLAALPAHVDLLDRVLALGGDANDEVHEPVFEAIPVDKLPPPHLPFKCALAERFEAIKANVGPEDVDQADSVRLGEQFLATLTADDRASCDFHAADWRSIAEESVRILETSPSADQDGLVTLARSCPLPSSDRRWLASLFGQPVVVHERSFGDGQHRGCALRFSGARQAVVVRRFRTLRVEPGVWIYGGDG